PGICKIQNEDQDGQQIVVGKTRRDDERAEQRERKHPTMPRNSLEQPRHDARFPRMPCGRNSSTSARIAKANMLFADGVKRSPASASVMPISTPPTSAPGIEPRPPVMTMTKAKSVYCGPSGGV